MGGGRTAARAGRAAGLIENAQGAGRKATVSSGARGAERRGMEGAERARMAGVNPAPPAEERRQWRSYTSEGREAVAVAYPCVARAVENKQGGTASGAALRQTEMFFLSLRRGDDRLT